MVSREKKTRRKPKFFNYYATHLECEMCELSFFEQMLSNNSFWLGLLDNSWLAGL